MISKLVTETAEYQTIDGLAQVTQFLHITVYNMDAKSHTSIIRADCLHIFDPVTHP
jgi:hypothetical protein